MFQGLQQGATLYILYRNEPRVESARVIAVNTHLPQYNPSQPQAIFNGMVTDVTLSVGNETIPFVGLPASASVANFPDKGVFLSEDKSLLINEVTTMQENSKRIIDSYDMHKDLYGKYTNLLDTLIPERAQESQIASLKGEIEELKGMLAAALGNKKNEN
jgi:hypothetical protein